MARASEERSSLATGSGEEVGTAGGGNGKPPNGGGNSGGNGGDGGGGDGEPTFFRRMLRFQLALFAMVGWLVAAIEAMFFVRNQLAKVIPKRFKRLRRKARQDTKSIRQDVSGIRKSISDLTDEVRAKSNPAAELTKWVTIVVAGEAMLGALLLYLYRAGGSGGRGGAPAGGN